MASDNPTQTRGIEARWQKEINRRFRRFLRVILNELDTINDRALATNTELGISGEQARIYIEFVKQQIADLLMGANSPPNWQANHQLAAYQKSLERFAAEMRAQGESLVASQLEAEIAATLEPFTATPSLGIDIGVAQQDPIHREALEFLFTRSYEKLENWTDQLATDVRQLTFDAVRTGDSVEELSRAIRLRTEVTRSRANVIAQTETNQAYGVAQTSQAQRTSEAIGQPVELRWITVDDFKVRHLHAEWHGTLASPEDSQRRKGVSPWNCRCGLAPVVQGADTPAKQKKFKRERKELVARVAAARS